LNHCALIFSFASIDCSGEDIAKRYVTKSLATRMAPPLKGHWPQEQAEEEQKAGNYFNGQMGFDGILNSQGKGVREIFGDLMNDFYELHLPSI
jgi:hypothetical protein